MSRKRNNAQRPSVSLERDDMQGLIIRAYSQHDYARFLLFRITDAAGARAWLSGNLAAITNGAERPGEACMNVAFTFDGLKALGLNADSLETFSPEFKEGIATEHRRRILGDHGASAPEKWSWGGSLKTGVHLIVLLYAQSAAHLDELTDKVGREGSASGLSACADPLETEVLADAVGTRKEHFGFRDGLSQPVIPELKEIGDPANWVAAGEFILGYPNEYDLYTERPMVEATHDRHSVLPEDVEGSSLRDLGKNGTYLVIRQLGQDVAGFWHFMSETAGKNGNGSDMGEHAAAVRLAAKMMGRWPSGAPLLKCPDADDPTLGTDNDFMFHREDPYGYRCPLGSHIRRTNTRDGLEPDPGTTKSLEIANRHRILRRGRPYGKPLVPSLDPSDMIGKQDDADRGLHFICCCGNLARQFEFIQHTWANNPKFAGLYEDVDPIVGDRNPFDHGTTDAFTIQAAPVRKRVKGMPQFVTVRGGAYFFLPGMRALRYLASM